MTEPMKCANGCGDYVWEVIPGTVIHIEQLAISLNWFGRENGGMKCRNMTTVATLPFVGIKSEDIKPVERPTLPTSREWLESDGEFRKNYGKAMCWEGERSFVCCRPKGHNGWHTASADESYDGVYVIGRWYTDGPFVEAK